MRIVFIASLLAVLVLVLLSGRGIARADEALPDTLTVIAVDGPAVARYAADARVARTVVHLAALVQKSGAVAFLSYGRKAEDPASYAAGSEELAVAEARFWSELQALSAGPADQLGALSVAFGRLSNSDAPSGSRLLLITAGWPDEASDGARQRLLDLAGLFPPQGWSVDVAMLPGASPGARETLAGLAAAAGGRSYDTGVVDGIAALVNDLNGLDTVAAIQTTLPRGETALAPIEVPPRTSQLTISGVRSTPGSLVEVFDPRGAPVTGVRADTTLIDSPVAVLMRVSEPEAGRWTVRATGDDSELLVGVEIRNPISLDLVDRRPVPTGEPAVLTAAGMIDGVPVPLPGAYIDATVRDPSGETVVHRLLDNGLGGDETAGDGIFSVALPAPQAQSLSDVFLRMGWNNYGAELKGVATVRAERFPAMTIRMLPPSSIDRGGTAAVAEIEVQVAEYPFPVDPSAVTFSVSQAGGPGVTARLLPESPLPDGRAWKFTVWASPPESGAYVVTADIATRYLGRDYAFGEVSAPVDIDVIPPPTPPLPPAVPELGPLSAVPGWGWALVGIGAAASALLALAWLIAAGRVEPYGYLYDDLGRMVIDFRRFRTLTPKRLFGAGRIRGAEIPGVPAGVGEFVFRHDGVELHADEAGPSMRVNGRPAGPRVMLTEGIRLGIAGRLFTFARHRAPPPTFGMQAGD